MASPQNCKQSVNYAELARSLIEGSICIIVLWTLLYFLIPIFSQLAGQRVNAIQGSLSGQSQQTQCEDRS